MEHIFHLGRDAELSALEVVSYLERTQKKYKILKITKKALLIDIPTLDHNETMKCLGGTIKISLELKNPEESIQNKIHTLTSRRISYGINSLESSSKSLQSLTNLIKSFCKKERIKALHKHSKEREIPPSKSQSLDLELTLFKNKIYAVVAASNPKSYAKRDEKRPYFDPLKVISVRLSKILINLAQPKRKDTLLDPFAGLGTILQEASLMNINSIGSDNNPQTVTRCKTNLQWVKQQFKVKKSPKIVTSDISQISKKIKSANCIATEPYLGPYLKKLPTEMEARNIAKDLSRLYNNFLKEASKILRTGSKVAVIVPTFKTKDSKTIRIGFQNLLKNHRFKIHQPLKNNLIPLDYVLRGSKIRRKIYILEKL